MESSIKSPKLPPMTRDTPIAWVDIETTGTDVVMHDILSIGVVRSDGQEREWYVQPSKAAIIVAEPKALEINGYTPEMWAERGQRLPYVVAHEFAAFVDGHILGAHNAAFDFPFLASFCRAYNAPLRVPYRPLCTVSMLWPLVLSGEIESPSCEKACAHFGVSVENAHEALADARRAKALYEAILRRNDAIAWSAG